MRTHNFYSRLWIGWRVFFCSLGWDARNESYWSLFSSFSSLFLSTLDEDANRLRSENFLWFFFTLYSLLRQPGRASCYGGVMSKVHFTMMREIFNIFPALTQGSDWSTEKKRRVHSLFSHGKRSFARFCNFFHIFSSLCFLLANSVIQGIFQSTTSRLNKKFSFANFLISRARELLTVPVHT